MTEAASPSNSGPRAKPPVVIHLPKRSIPAPTLEQSPLDRPSFTPIQKPNPLTVAVQQLRNRLKERDGAYFLDGTPANLDRIMRETNRVLKADSLEQLTACSRWLA